jgi:hypothetical protein
VRFVFFHCTLSPIGFVISFQFHRSTNTDETEVADACGRVTDLRSLCGITGMIALITCAPVLHQLSNKSLTPFLVLFGAFSLIEKRKEQKAVKGEKTSLLLETFQSACHHPAPSHQIK